MDVTVNRTIMLKAFGDVAAVVPTRTPKPILHSVLLTTGEDGATLAATDLEIGLRRSLGGVSTGMLGSNPGRLLLPAARVKEILSRATGDEIHFQLDDADQKIRVRCGKAKWDLPSENPDLFPEPRRFEATAYHAIEARDLLAMIRRTVFAVNLESTRYAMGGVLLELLAAGVARTVGTDGRRLAMQEAPAEAIGGPPAYLNAGGTVGETRQAPVIPVKVLHLLSRLIRPEDAPVHIAVNATNDVMFRTSEAEVYSRLVEGRFPRYQDVFTEPDGPRLTLAAGPLREVLEQAAIATSDESRGVDIEVKPGVMTFRAQAADVGQGEAELEITHDGERAVTTYDPRYVLEPLRALGDDTTISLSVSEKSGNLLTTEDRYQYVVMPLTRDR